MSHSPHSAAYRATRVFQILGNFLTRLDRQRRPHPEMLELTAFAVERFMEMAYAVGALESCLEATKLGMTLAELAAEPDPSRALRAQLLANRTGLEAAFRREAEGFEASPPEPARIPEAPPPAAAPPPGCADSAVPAEAAPENAAPGAPGLAPQEAAPEPIPSGPEPAPPPAAADAASPFGAGEPWPDGEEEGAFAYLGTEAFPFDPELTQIFLTEAGEQLPQVERLLLMLEAEPERGEDIHDLFRLLHTIKGNAGFLGLREFIRLVHAMEQYLEPFRSRKAPGSAFSAALMLEGADALNLLLGNLQRRCDLLTAQTTDAAFALVPWEALTTRIQGGQAA